MMIQDTGRPFAAQVVANGQSTVFDLPVESIGMTNVPTVTINGAIVNYNQATPQYVIDYKHGVITFPSAPSLGTTIAIQGTTYDFFDDDEVTQAVQDAFNLHVNDLEPLPVIDPVGGQPVIPSTEEYLVSIMAAVELLWFRSTDASMQIDIHTPDGVTIPRSERFRQIMEQIQSLQEEYKSLAGALGVGIWRIQVLNMRRVSMTTNRYVPLYREQEYNQPYAAFFPTAAAVGTLIQITGMYLTGTTSVTFGGVPAPQFTIVSDTEITVVVPPNAVTGQIGVTTPWGTVLSTAQFVVGQPPPFILYGPEMVKPPIPPGL
jgi:IPT/TIG domain